MLHGGWWRIFDGVWDMIAYLLRYYVYINNKRASANSPTYVSYVRGSDTTFEAVAIYDRRVN
jgi:hypothetical protein